MVMLTTYYAPRIGGLEVLLGQLSRELGQRGHEVLVITSHATEAPPGFDEVDGTRVFRIPLHLALDTGDRTALLRARRDLIRVIGDFAPDVVHAHDVGPVAWLYRRISGRARCPLVITLHNVRTHFDTVTGIVAPMLEDADWVTGVSRDVADDAVALAPGVADRISVIPNGVIPALSVVGAVPVDPPRLACIGRLVPQKGFDRAVDALARLSPRHPELRMTVAGDGPERGPLVDRARTLAVADRIEFRGMVDRDDVARIFEASTAVVMPSHFEGFPLVALEAAWAGRPVVATRVPGLEEAVADGESGLVVAADVGAVAGAIERLLSDPALARRLGAGARARAERQYSITACADAYEALYARLVRETSIGAGYDSPS